MVLTLFYVALAISAVILLTVGFLTARTTRRTRTQADEIRDEAFSLTKTSRIPRLLSVSVSRG